MIDRKPVAAAALAVAVLTVGSAVQAQTTTRTITVAPVETVITQDANGNTLVTRRPLQSAPAPMTFTPPPLDSLVKEPVDPSSTFVPPQRTPPPVVAQGVTRHSMVRSAPRQASRQTKRTVAQRARPVATRTVRHARPAATQRVRMARPAARTGGTRLASAPVLDAVQRQYIYRSIVEQEVVSSGGALSFAPPTQPGIFAQTEIVTPSGVTGYPVATAVRRPVSTTIGSRLPATVPLVAVPDAASEHMRWLARYRYAIVNNRVLLVDPDTCVIVADLTR